MDEIIMLPGIGGSGEDHWQSHWQRTWPNVQRFAPPSWNDPDLLDWISALDRAIGNCGAPPVLVAHSLSCLLIAHWSQCSASAIKGAFLVAVPDPASVVFPNQAAGFADPPTQKFDFPSIIIASSNDPYASLDYARLRAVQWGSRLVELTALGHVNERSGLGDWPAGQSLLAAFLTDAAMTAGWPAQDGLSPETDSVRAIR